MNQLGGGGDGRQVTVSIQPDQETLQARQQELQEELLAGNIS
jgi:predicted MarR family transcription regulator